MSQVREQTQKLHQDIIEGYYEQGLSHAALSKKFGRSEAMVKKILTVDRKANGLRERTVKPADARNLGEMKALSFRHFRIGLEITRYMTAKNMSPSWFGMLGNLSASRFDVRRMEIGAYDLTLTQIEALCEILEMPFEELMNIKQEVKESRPTYA